MSLACTPTDNAAMKAIIGWTKAELFMNLHAVGENIQQEADDYVFFINQCPAYSRLYDATTVP